MKTVTVQNQFLKSIFVVTKGSQLVAILISRENESADLDCVASARASITQRLTRPLDFMSPFQNTGGKKNTFVPLYSMELATNAQRCLHLPHKQVRKAAPAGSEFSLQLTFESTCHQQYCLSQIYKSFPLIATAVAIMKKSLILV